MKITYIHHSSFSVELDNAILLFDYFKGNLPSFDKNKKLLVNRIASLLTLLSKTVCLENCYHNGLPRKPIGFLAITHNW